MKTNKQAPESFPTHEDAYKNLWRIVSYAKKYWKQLTVSGICASLFGLFSAAPSYMIQHTVDNVFVNRMEHLLVPFILVFLALFALKGLFMYLSSYYMNWVGFKVVNDIRSDLFKATVDFPLSFYQKKTSGRIMAHFLNDINLIQDAASSAIRNGMRSLFEAIFLLSVAILQSWQLSLMMMIIGPIIALSIKKMSGAVRSSSRKAQSEMGTLSSLLQEILTGIREIKSFNTQKIEKRRFNQYLETYFTTIMQCIHFQSIGPAFIEITAMTGIGAMLYVAALQVLHGSMTPGQLSSFFAAILLAYQPIKRLVNVYNDVFYALGAADRVFEVMDTQFDEPERTKNLLSFNQRLELKNVSFAYVSGSDVLKNINLTIEKGEHIGIVGPSGSGKSTLCDLLMGFIQPTSGSIVIDGHNMQTLTRESLTNAISYVGQRTFLFNDTVQANVSYARQGSPLYEVEAACKAAHADEFIMELPKGYLTPVGENGTLLSGGQKQRLTIARALLKNTPIILFDEATSSLDAVSEEHIRKAIESIGSDKTLIVISHRLAFLEKMDRIVRVEDGLMSEVRKNVNPGSITRVKDTGSSPQSTHKATTDFAA